MPKLWVVTKALKLRDRLGPYAALPIAGERSDRAIAYSRGDVITVAPRFPIDASDWADTSIDLPKEKNWRNVFTGEEIAEHHLLLSTLFRRFPVALLAAS